MPVLLHLSRLPVFEEQEFEGMLCRFVTFCYFNTNYLFLHVNNRKRQDLKHRLSIQTQSVDYSYLHRMPQYRTFYHRQVYKFPHILKQPQYLFFKIRVTWNLLSVVPSIETFIILDFGTYSSS